MKILMYSVRPDEQPAIQAWATSHDAIIDTTTDILSTQTVDQANGYDSIVIAQHGPLDEPEIYSKLASFGIHHLALRITGYNIIDFNAAKANHIIITNVPAYSPRSVAEQALMHTMVQLRHLELTTSRMRQHDFTWGGLEAAEIHNLTVGIFGLGKIGSSVARIFKALGARVIATDLIMRPELADTVEYVDFDTLLAQSDVLTLHPNLTAKTTGMINSATLAKMKPSAILINCARGPLVDTPALITALKTGTIAGAGLDCVTGEELVLDHDLSTDSQTDLTLFDELLALPNVSFTPHTGFYTDAAVKNMVDIALNDVATILAGQKSLHQVS